MSRLHGSGGGLPWTEVGTPDGSAMFAGDGRARSLRAWALRAGGTVGGFPSGWEGMSQARNRNVGRSSNRGEASRIPPSHEGMETTDLSEPREIKVRLPIALHIKLHSLKITKGRAISVVVSEALEQYFDRLEKK